MHFPILSVSQEKKDIKKYLTSKWLNFISKNYLVNKTKVDAISNLFHNLCWNVTGINFIIYKTYQNFQCLGWYTQDVSKANYNHIKDRKLNKVFSSSIQRVLNYFFHLKVQLKYKFSFILYARFEMKAWRRETGWNICVLIHILDLRQYA